MTSEHILQKLQQMQDHKLLDLLHEENDFLDSMGMEIHLNEWEEGTVLRDCYCNNIDELLFLIEEGIKHNRYSIADEFVAIDYPSYIISANKIDEFISLEKFAEHLRKNYYDEDITDMLDR